MWLSDLWPFCDAPPGGTGRTLCVCAVYPHSHVAIILFLSLSLTHLFRMLHASCVILWSAWRSGCPPLPWLSSPFSVVVHSALLVSLFLTPCGSISHLYFLGLLTQLKKPNNAKKYEEEVEKKESTNILLYIWLRISFLSFRFVCFCLLFALFKHFYDRTKNARNVSVTFMMWQCYLTNPADTCTVVILSISHTSHKSPSLLGTPFYECCPWPTQIVCTLVTFMRLV